MRHFMHIGRKAAFFSLPAILLASAAVPSAMAQEQIAANQPIEFVTVTATRGATQQDLDVSSTILTSGQVLEEPEPTIDQIVNKIPGIFTSQQPSGQLHPTGQPFSIRGFGTSTNINTLLLVDGVPANDPYFRTVDWSQVPKDSVESIEVIRGGGASSAWGNLAMGGIVDVVTRQAQPGYILDVNGGSFNAIDGFASAGFQVADGLDVSVSADGGRTDGYNQTPAQYRNPYMVSTSSQTQDYHLSAVYQPDNATDLYVSLTHHRIAEYGLVWDIAHNAWETDRFAAGGSRALGDAQSANFTLWYGEGSMFTQNASSNPSFSIFTPQNGVPFVSQTETVTYHHMGGSLFYKADWGDFKDIEVGVDGREIWAHDPLNIFSATKQTGAITADAKHHFEGIYAQGSWRPTGIPLEVTAGAREDFWQAVDAGIAGNFQGSTIADTVPNETYTHFSPRVGAKYFLPDGFDLRVAAYSDFAAPGMNQMYRSFISGTSYTTFDATLKPQTNFGREIGADWNSDKYQVSFTLYDNSLTRFIDYATVENACALANNYCGTGITAIAGGSLHQYVNAGNADPQGRRAARLMESAGRCFAQWWRLGHRRLPHQLQLHDAVGGRDSRSHASATRPSSALDDHGWCGLAGDTSLAAVSDRKEFSRLLGQYRAHPARRRGHNLRSQRLLSHYRSSAALFDSPKHLRPKVLRHRAWLHDHQRIDRDWQHNSRFRNPVQCDRRLPGGDMRHRKKGVTPMTCRFSRTRLFTATALTLALSAPAVARMSMPMSMPMSHGAGGACHGAALACASTVSPVLGRRHPLACI